MPIIPNLNPNDLVIFCVVAKEKSLSSAAEKLSLTQPAVTYHIQSLEKFTRVKLIEFKRHQATLTPHGQELLKYAEGIYERLVDAERYIKFVRESNLRVGIASVYDMLLTPLLQELFDERDHEVKLMVKSGNAFEMVQDVLDSTLDLAIVPKFDYPGEKLNYVRVSNPEEIVCFAAAQQPLPDAPLGWGDLYKYPLVSGPETSVIRRVIFDKYREIGLEEPVLAAEVGTVEWCKTLVENGRGLSFTLLKDIEKQVEEGRFKLVPLKESLSITAESVTRMDIDNPIIQKFIMLVKKAFNYTS
ncbi:MAG TPA: LysR family transcriptional regulator [Spirochaetes bacterium]|nr:LysR family transcriptional regulator [Spirochaetota bacterium]